MAYSHHITPGKDTSLECIEKFIIIPVSSGSTASLTIYLVFGLNRKIAQRIAIREFLNEINFNSNRSSRYLNDLIPVRFSFAASDLVERRNTS